MRNLWLIARHEYDRMVRKRSFILSVVGIPLLMVATIGFAIFTMDGGQSELAVGYVDLAGVLSAGIQASAPDGEQTVPLLSFDDMDAANAALQRGEIQAYYVVPAGYPQPPSIDLYHQGDAPDREAQETFQRHVQANLLDSHPKGVRDRILEGNELVVRTQDGRREMSEETIVNFVLPFVAAFFFFMAVMASSGYLLQVVADEKENRTVEIMITSMTPEALIGGKALGLMAVALTMMVAWGLAIALGVLIGAQFFEPLSRVTIPWSFLLITLLFFFPAYALIAGMMTAVGGATAELQQGQQIAGLLNLMFITPMLFSALLLAQPDGVLATFMTFFPTTSFLTIALRWSMSVVPTWQLVVSWLLTSSTAILAVWASARIFRAGMLRYGKRMNLQNLLGAIGWQGSDHA